MTIGARIKQVRKEREETQKEFADKLGLKQNTIATYEMGRIAPSDRTIFDICDKFGVNEEWLRTGEGEMLVKKTREQELREFFQDILKGSDNFKTRFVAALAVLDQEQWEMVEKMLRQLAAEVNREE